MTGIVEDSIAARVRQKEALMLKNYETLTGLRLMEGGRAFLVAGVWGVHGLRRRILVSRSCVKGVVFVVTNHHKLYQPYSQLTILQIFKQERDQSSFGHMLFAGMPTVFAYHLSDWAAFFLETVVEAIWDEEDKDGLSNRQSRLRSSLTWL